MVVILLFYILFTSSIQLKCMIVYEIPSGGILTCTSETSLLVYDGGFMKSHLEYSNKFSPYIQPQNAKYRTGVIKLR